MSFNTQWDGIEFSSLDFPYDKVTRELSEKPRLVDGLNAYVTLGGKLGKRPGTIFVPNTALNQRIDRLWLYETLGTPPLIYILASVYTGAVWQMFYLRLDSVSPAWTFMGTTRKI